MLGPDDGYLRVFPLDCANRMYSIEVLDEERTGCMAALLLTKPKDDRELLIHQKGSRVNGTCIWIKEDASYNSWFHSDSQLLWLSGGPGKGKTMLSIFLSEELEHLARPSHGTVFLEYYCDNKDDRRNSAIAILRGLLYQLLESRPSLYKYIMAEFQHQGEKLLSSFPSLWNIFREMLRDPDLKTVYCVLDGLDECDGDSLEWLLQKLKCLFLTDLGSRIVCHLKMIIASRDHPDLIKEVLSSFPHITLDRIAGAEINHDIHRFIEDRVNEISKLKRYPDQLSVHVKDVFKERAQGTFLWIGIAAQDLREYIVTEVEEALKFLPSGLEPLFARMLLQIKPERRQTIAQILRWVVLAARPLTVSELSIAIKQSPHNHENEHTVAFSREEVTRDHILNCRSLLSVTKGSVDLIHQSIKDYLLRKMSDWNPELEFYRVEEEKGNLEIARQCFHYLQDVALVGEPPVEHSGTFIISSARRQALSIEFPLLSYAIQYWPMHASALDHEDDIFDVSQPFYQEPKFCAIWMDLYHNLDDDLKRFILYDFLVIAAVFNLKILTKNIISAYHSMKNEKFSSAKDRLNEPTMNGLTVLHLAAELGLLALCQLLLDEEVSIDTRDNSGNTALHIAVKNGYLVVAQLLLDRGASIEAKNSYEVTPLYQAAQRGCSAMVILLLDRGASTEVRESDKETPLHCAARGGHSAVVRLLLDRGAVTGAENLCGETPLHNAIQREHSPVVRLLLDRGALTEARTLSKETPLHYAAWSKLSCYFEERHAISDSLAMLSLLLDRGALQETKIVSNKGALRYAAWLEDNTVMEALLDKGASTEAENEHGMRPLHIAAILGIPAMAQLLLNYRADITAKTKKGNTPLHYAAVQEDEELVQLLLDRGASKEAKNVKDMTPLHAAIQEDSPDAIAVLLLHKANVNSQDRDGRMALHYVAQAMFRPGGLTQLLLNNGADLEAKCSKGRTALHTAAKSGHLTIVQVLLDKGALIDVQDDSERTALHYVAGKGHTSTLQLLLNRGASTEITNCDGLTVLREAKIDNREAVVQILERHQRKRKRMLDD